MSAGHTPGPWLYRGKSDTVHKASDTHPYGEAIFRFEEEQLPSDEDLNLILAAPELLEALDACMGTLTACFPDAPVDSVIGKNIVGARAAIAKATGETA